LKHFAHADGQITQSYPLLLTHLTTSLALSSQLAPIRSSLGSLNSSIERLHTKIHDPHVQMFVLVRRLSLLAQASDLSRRAARFVLLARRLDGQMVRVRDGAAGDGARVGDGEKERELAKAALSVAELDALLVTDEDDAGDDDDDGNMNNRTLSLHTLDFVRAYAPTVDKARDAIIAEMEAMVVSGLASLNQPLLSSSLQTAHNLHLLPDLVSNLVADLNDAVAVRVQKAFDSATIGREVAGKGASGHVNLDAVTWSAGLVANHQIHPTRSSSPRAHAPSPSRPTPTSASGLPSSGSGWIASLRMLPTAALKWVPGCKRNLPTRCTHSKRCSRSSGTASHRSTFWRR
jgi:hypothetical protein